MHNFPGLLFNNVTVLIILAMPKCYCLLVKIIKLDGDINVSHSVSGGYNRLFETFEEIDYKFSRQFIVCNEYKRSKGYRWKDSFKSINGYVLKSSTVTEWSVCTTYKSLSEKVKNMNWIRNQVVFI